MISMEELHKRDHFDKTKQLYFHERGKDYYHQASVYLSLPSRTRSVYDACEAPVKPDFGATTA
jgi:hypothetical protein